MLSKAAASASDCAPLMTRKSVNIPCRTHHQGLPFKKVGGFQGTVFWGTSQMDPQKNLDAMNPFHFRIRASKETLELNFLSSFVPPSSKKTSHKVIRYNCIKQIPPRHFAFWKKKNCSKHPTGKQRKKSNEKNTFTHVALLSHPKQPQDFAGPRSAQNQQPKDFHILVS